MSEPLKGSTEKDGIRSAVTDPHHTTMSRTSPSPDAGPGTAASRLANLTESNLALVGEPMVGKSEVALDALAAAGDRDGLLVTTARGAGRIDSDRLEGVDVVDATPGDAPEGVRSVGSPADVTGISMPVSEFLDGADEPLVVVDSLSSLLMYNESDTVFRFLSVLTSHVKRAGGLALFTIDEGCHDEQTIRTFAQLFDGRVRVREGPTGPQAQARGVDELPGDWVSAGRHY